MTYLDAAILNFTEWSCRRFQLLTGTTNVWLAVQLTNLSIIAYFIWAGAYFYIVRAATIRFPLAIFCAALLYTLTQTIFKVPIEAYENSAYRRVAKGFRNPRRVRDVPLRISFLTLSMALCIVLPALVSAYPILLKSVTLHTHLVLLTYFLVVMTTVVLYLLACDPLPPCPGKVRDWIRATFRSRLSATEAPSD